MKKQSFLKDEHLPFITWVGNPSEIKQIHIFVKNDQSMTRIGFKEVYDEIRDFLANQDVNFGILLMADGTYVFTEKKVKMNAVMVKLATGVNYHGAIPNAKVDLDVLNKHLSEKTK